MKKHGTEFPVDKIALEKIFSSPRLQEFNFRMLDCQKVRDVYGEFLFPPVPKERPYTFGSFVSSIDGRIAYPESHDGTLIAKTNLLDSGGGLADFWILNLLRAACDTVLMGSATLKREPGLTGKIFDDELRAARIEDGRPELPLHLVVSNSGANLPLDHPIIASGKYGTIIALSNSGLDKVSGKLPPKLRESAAVFRITSDEDLVPLKKYNPAGRLTLIGAGVPGPESGLDVPLLMRAVRALGTGRMLVESPTFLSSLMKNRMLDELFLNVSGIFIGGKALTIGENSDPFSIELHPHARTLSVHRHGDSFFYHRYFFEYGIL